MGRVGPSKLRLRPRSMPDVKNLNPPRLLREILKDAIRAKNDFAQRTSRASRKARANERERSQEANVIDDPAPCPRRRLWIPRGDINTGVAKVGDRRVGPDYLEIHAVAQDSSRRSASACVLVRPALTSPRPRRMAAMMRSSSMPPRPPRQSEGRADVWEAGGRVACAGQRGQLCQARGGKLRSRRVDNPLGE